MQRASQKLDNSSQTNTGTWQYADNVSIVDIQFTHP